MVINAVEERRFIDRQLLLKKMRKIMKNFGVFTMSISGETVPPGTDSQDRPVFRKEAWHPVKYLKTAGLLWQIVLYN